MMYSRRTIQVSIGSLFLITIMLSLIPVFQTITKLKGGYRGVPPTSYIEDDIYYYGRMKEVIDGKPLLGNPYFIEYRDSVAPAFFVPDWIAVIPLLLGVPFSIAIIFNLVIWSLIFVFLAYLVGRAFDMPPPHSAILALVAYIEVYWLIFRPVTMQQVFPFFLIFLLAFFTWLRCPLQRRSMWFLVVAGTLSFYIYSYLWEVVFVTLGIVFLHKLLQRKWPEVRALLKVAIGTVILSLPAITYIIYQVHIPYFWETMGRLGLSQSHLPSLGVYYYGRWVIIICIFCLLIQKWLVKRETSEERGVNNVVTLATIYSGCGLLIMVASNVFTGQDLDTATHVGRFITLWIALFFPAVLWRLYLYRREILKLYWLKFLMIGLFVIACIGFLGLNLKRSLPFKNIAKADAVTVQTYAEPLKWLDAREKLPIVIWADAAVSCYVPILTKHYVFWCIGGGAHFMSTKEVEDRFLASQIKALTKDELLASYGAFEGWGAGYRYNDALNKNQLQCLIGRECKPDPSMLEWVGTAKLDALLKRQSELRGNILAVMKEYHVSYLVADTSKGEDKYFKELPGTTEVWKNNQFVIYQFK